jgi:hypothetical protein
MSKKRILPALILAGSAGFLGVHRFYAGRHITGLLQLVLFILGAVMLSRDLSGIESLQTLDQIQDWILRHQIHPLPVLLLAIPSFWALVDCILLALRRFKDGNGEMMTHWV